MSRPELRSRGFFISLLASNVPRSTAHAHNPSQCKPPLSSLAGGFERDLETTLSKEERDYIRGLQGPLEIARDDQQEPETARDDEPRWPDQDDVTINIQAHQDMTSNIAGGKFNSSGNQTIAPPSKQHDKSRDRD